MKREAFIELTKLADYQKQTPGVIPVFERIVKKDGKMIGEVRAYCDEYGVPLPAPDLYH